MKSKGLQQQQKANDDTITMEKNLMPSMVVRQQRIQMGTSANQQHHLLNQRPITNHGGIDKLLVSQQHLPISNINNNHHHPYLLSEKDRERTPFTTTVPTSSLIKAAKADQLNQAANAAGEHQRQQQHQVFDKNGLILPRRVMHHPVSVAQPIIRDLNRELKFNQIRGKNVLDQKSELKKALEKLEVSKKKKEAEQERLSRRSSLELRLEERAEKIVKETSSNKLPENQSQQQQGPPTKGSMATTCKALSNFSIKSMTR